jgi:hypothetical protein
MASFTPTQRDTTGQIIKMKINKAQAHIVGSTICVLITLSQTLAIQPMLSPSIVEFFKVNANDSEYIVNGV